jgi:hypothetical protein
MNSAMLCLNSLPRKSPETFLVDETLLESAVRLIYLLLCKPKKLCYFRRQKSLKCQCPGHNRKTEIGHGRANDGNNFYASATLNSLLLVCLLLS